LFSELQRPMRRRKRRRLRLAEPEFHHNVYVVLLSKAALKDLSIWKSQERVQIGPPGQEIWCSIVAGAIRASEPDAVRICCSNGKRLGRRLARSRLRHLRRNL